MEKIANLHIEKLPEGMYLGTSDSIQGLVVKGRTVVETIEIARNVVKRLLEAQPEQAVQLNDIEESFDYPLVVGI